MSAYIMPKRFYLKRDTDLTGVSGVGKVADGVQFQDGTCVIHWRSAFASTGVYPDLETVEKVHLHGGSTKLIWHDTPGRDYYNE